MIIIDLDNALFPFLSSTIFISIILQHTQAKQITDNQKEKNSKEINQST
jgi:hypothetical protein